MKFNERVIDLLNNKELSKLDIKRLEGIFPELKENDDERIRKALITYFKNLSDVYSLEPLEINPKEAIAWLEKQVEQKQWDSVEPVSEEDKLYLMPEEQKPADKVEPKFKVGDWVVQENIGTYKVVEVCESWYEVIDSQNNHYSIGFDKEYMCHLWTIQDAKDGDVLTTYTWTFIFKKCQDKSVCYHCAASAFNNFSISDTGEFDSNYVHPATKEQRDLLFQKMKEEEYEWDAEKKELKKIEDEPGNHKQQVMSEMTDLVKYYIRQKPTWSEEDEYLLDETITHLEELIRITKKLGSSYSDEIQYYQRYIYWLKSLKDKVGARVQPRNMWISVDKEVYIKEPVLAQKKDKSDPFKGYVVCCDHTLDPNIYKRYIRLDKSFPHITWKPSDEQLNNILDVLSFDNCTPKRRELLESLYQDLKNLKG